MLTWEASQARRSVALAGVCVVRFTDCSSAIHTASEVCPLVNGRTASKKEKKNKGKAILCSKSSNFTVDVTAPLGSRSKRLWSSRGCVRLSVGHTKCLPLLDTPASQHIVSTVNMVRCLSRWLEGCAVSTAKRIEVRVAATPAWRSSGRNQKQEHEILARSGWQYVFDER